MKTLVNKLEKVMYLVLFLSSGIVAGQGTGVLYTCNDAYAYWNIVRFSPNYGFVNVSKPLSSAGIHLSLTGLGNIIDAFFPDNYDVKDMEIIDDTVFFCGVDNVSGSGFLGWFDINDLFYASGSIHIDNTLLTLGLQRLDNIEVFRDQTGKVHVVGFGLHDFLPSKQYYAFEAVGYPVSGMYYKTADLINGGNWDDIRDIAVTDNYVVYLECERNYPCHPHHAYGIKLKAFPKYDMFSASQFTEGFFQTITNHYAHNNVLGCGFVLPDNDDPYNWEAKMVHIGEDKVAVCSYRSDLDNTNWTSTGCDPLSDCIGGINPNKYYLAHRIYDISPILTNQPMVMLSAAIAELPDDVYNIDCFLFDNQNNTYIVQHRLKTSPTTWETAFTTLDFSSGSTPLYAISDYQTYVNTYTDWLPESMCLFGDGGYLVSGRNLTDFSHFFWKSNINYVDGNCDKHQQYPMVEIPTYVSKDNQFLINASGTILVFDECFPEEVREMELLIKCN